MCTRRTGFRRSTHVQVASHRGSQASRRSPVTEVCGAYGDTTGWAHRRRKPLIAGPRINVRTSSNPTHWLFGIRTPRLSPSRTFRPRGESFVLIRRPLAGMLPARLDTAHCPLASGLDATDFENAGAGWSVIASRSCGTLDFSVGSTRASSPRAGTDKSHGLEFEAGGDRRRGLPTLRFAARCSELQMSARLPNLADGRIARQSDQPAPQILVSGKAASG